MIIYIILAVLVVLICGFIMTYLYKTNKNISKYFPKTIDLKLKYKEGLYYVSLYYYIPLRHRYKRLTFLVDTGSPVSCINTNLINQKYGKELNPLPKEEDIYFGICNKFTHIKYECTLPLGTIHHFEEHTFYCVDDLNFDGILGTDWLDKHKAHINVKRKRLILQNPNTSKNYYNNDIFSKSTTTRSK